MRRALPAVALAVTVAISGCSGEAERAPTLYHGNPSAAPTPSSQLPADGPDRKAVRVVAVGDIACDPTSPHFVDDPDLCQQDAVGELVGSLVDDGARYFLPLGDIQYEAGESSAFDTVYDPAFGRLLPITEPVAGNHEWKTDGASGYFEYFGSRAGTATEPWRSFRPVKGWQVLLLDSNCSNVGGCGPESPQGRWVTETLAASRADCVLAAWHHPLRTSGEYYGDSDSGSRAAQLWESLVPAGVDLVLNGHDHLYERFAKLDEVQQFTVGTGGKDHSPVTTRAEGSQEVIDDMYGALELTLSPSGWYRYAFHSVDGRVLDRGAETCSNNGD